MYINFEVILKDGAIGNSPLYPDYETKLILRLLPATNFPQVYAD